MDEFRVVVCFLLSAFGFLVEALCMREEGKPVSLLPALLLVSFCPRGSVRPSARASPCPVTTARNLVRNTIPRHRECEVIKGDCAKH